MGHLDAYAALKVQGNSRIYLDYGESLIYCIQGIYTSKNVPGCTKYEGLFLVITVLFGSKHQDGDRHYRSNYSERSFWSCASILNVEKHYRYLLRNSGVIACSLCREEYPDTIEGAIQGFAHFYKEHQLGKCNDVEVFSSYALFLCSLPTLSSYALFLCSLPMLSSYALFYNHIRYFHHAEDGIWAPLWRNARMRGNGTY